MEISYELLMQFRNPTSPHALYPDKPPVIGSMLVQAIKWGWLASAVPFGGTLKGSETVWKETLVLTREGLEAMGT